MLLHWYGEPFLQCLIPLFKWQIQLMDDQYQLLSLSIQSLGTDRVFSMQVNLAKTLLVGGQFILPDAKGVATVSSTVAHVWQMVVIFLSLLVAWPVVRYVDYGRRTLIGIPLLILILMFDMPFALLANVWGLILSQLSLERFSALILWNEILESGGRTVLGLVGGVLTVWLAEHVAKLKGIARQL